MPVKILMEIDLKKTKSIAEIHCKGNYWEVCEALVRIDLIREDLMKQVRAKQDMNKIEFEEK